MKSVYKKLNKIETTPEQNTRNISEKLSNEIKEKLLRSEILLKQIRENKKKFKSQKEKAIFLQVIAVE